MNDDGYLLFLSHVTKDSDLVLSTADALVASHLEVFVAQRDIPEGEEWLPYIQSALGRCDAVAAFLGDGFRESEWTDQEIGYALGAGKRVVPLRRSPHLPHGFLRRIQAPEISGLSGAEIADAILDVLLRYPDQQPKLTDVLVGALERDRDTTALQASMSRLALVLKLPEPYVDRLRSIATANSVIRHDRSLRDNLQAIISRGEKNDGRQ